MTKQPQAAPFAVRLTPEERSQLERQAAGMSLGAFVRSRLFDQSISSPRVRRKFPVKDHQSLSHVLAQLGAMTVRLRDLDTSIVTEDAETALIAIAQDFHAMRTALLDALGLHGSSS